MLTGLRGYHQLDGYSCGAVLACTLYAATRELTPEVIAGLWGITSPHPQHGTSDTNFRQALASIDLKMRKLAGKAGIIRSLEQGNIVATTLQLPWQRGRNMHWMAIVGHRPETDEFLLLNQTRRPGFAKKWWTWEKMEEATLNRTDCFYTVSTALPADQVADGRWVQSLSR